MNSYHRLIFTIVLTITFSSCGVIFGGSKFRGSVIVKDNPNAEIYVDGNRIGKGAGIGLFPRKRPLTVELRQGTCAPKVETFGKAFRGGNFALSIFSWGWLGIGVDLISGAVFKPGHRSNPAVEKVNYKNFVFTMTYSECSSDKISITNN